MQQIGYNNISIFSGRIFPLIPSSYSAEQTAYANRVAAYFKEHYSTQPLAHVITYGCQQNVSDSERMKGELALMGYGFTADPAKADFILFNTCAVREHAEDRVYGNVGAMKRYKRTKKGMLIGVCGCMTQQDRVVERFQKSFPFVDLVFGTQVQHRLPEFIYRRLTTGKRVYETKLDNAPIEEGVPVRRDGTLKGWLPIMAGCDNFCTYCIVPYVRGRERSRDPEEIIYEATEMVRSGFKEIMLLGQNVNSYGKGLDEPVNFAQLLRRVNAIEGDFRIRFMTSHPKDCSLELLDAIRDCEKVAKHLHLPFQSGSDRILKTMNRHYDREKYSELIRQAKERIPQITLSADIIVGFPGESYEDFKQTISLVEEVQFASLFTFIFSPREGTPAAKMADPVSREEKGKWFQELLAVQEKINETYLKNTVGTVQRVLLEELSERDGFCIGHTDGNVSVEVQASPELLGSLVTVHIDSYERHLVGTIC
ncbi:MAG: tRNA (N6-isopentenyl adenosine(37)-C2)-methylthiotransferase MiaB [Clostridia bacterium]|nr:tRNA (N6-isopentenyl adenosine(37)-C2)-methylthiotransferase MiaB [Clostridia bacterium]